MARLENSESTNGNRTASLGVAATRGVFWVGGAQVFRQLLGLATSVVLARLLNPADFGLVALALVFVELGQQFADFGIGAAVIQAKEVTRKVLASAFWANVAVGSGLMLIMIGLAPAVGYFYHDARVAWVLASLSFSLLVSGMMVVPRATLHKSLKFDLAVKAQMIGSVVGATVAISMAWHGLGVWSLVAQPICGSTTTLALTIRYARWRPHLEFSWDSIRKLARFSVDVLGSSIANNITDSADKLLIGKFLGNTALGLYSLAFQIMLYPVIHVASVIVKVLFPTLSALQDDPPRFRQAYLRSTAAIAVVTFPMMIGLNLVSADLVTVALGPKWHDLIPIIQILCWVGMGKSISVTAGTIYLSTASTRAMLRLALVVAPVTVIAVLVGMQWGVIGVAIGYAVAWLMFCVAFHWIAYRIAGLRFQDLGRALVRPATAAFVMGGAVWSVQPWLQTYAGLGAVGRLACSVALGAIVYVAMSLVVNREQVYQLGRISLAALRTHKAVAS